MTQAELLLDEHRSEEALQILQTLRATGARQAYGGAAAGTESAAAIEKLGCGTESARATGTTRWA